MVTTTNDGARQASVRAVTGTALAYDGDWHALFTAAAIPAGQFDGRLLDWINLKLSTAYTNLPKAQQALAASLGVYNWSSIGTFDATTTPAAPTNIAVPEVSGTLTVGQTLSTSDGSWTGAPTGYAYKWQAATDGSGTGAADISSATSATYVLASGQANKYVRSGVLASNGVGAAAAYAFSAWSGPVDSGGGSYTPALQFNDARNSQYLGSVSV
jgi:hypothetical protein